MTLARPWEGILLTLSQGPLATKGTVGTEMLSRLIDLLQRRGLLVEMMAQTKTSAPWQAFWQEVDRLGLTPRQPATGGRRKCCRTREQPDLLPIPLPAESATPDLSLAQGIFQSLFRDLAEKLAQVLGEKFEAGIAQPSTDADPPVAKNVPANYNGETSLHPSTSPFAMLLPLVRLVTAVLNQPVAASRRRSAACGTQRRGRPTGIDKFGLDGAWGGGEN